MEKESSIKSSCNDSNDSKYTEPTTKQNHYIEAQDGVTKVTLFLKDVYMSSVERAENNAKRWFKFCIALLIAFVITNFGWLIYEIKYDSVVITQDVNVDNSGDASVTGNIGDVIYSPNKEDNQSQEKKK